MVSISDNNLQKRESVMQLEMMEMPTIWMTLVMLLFVTEVMALFVATIVCVTS